ncbi:hypothetical protein A9E74_00092 [Methylophaga muralis]|uniref:Uncharacterized protein n=1 Tax=Methylophaga muralis TaxID=291169 RepID=A0A1E3GVN8_9GAMM|nr:hypothetical protein A9E74_00092 [Methylophaga muralis]
MLHIYARRIGSVVSVVLLIITLAVAWLFAG